MSRVMLVGLTHAGRLLEVGVEYVDDDHEHIFHGTDATEPYSNVFEKRKR